MMRQEERHRINVGMEKGEEHNTHHFFLFVNQNSKCASMTLFFPVSKLILISEINLGLQSTKTQLPQTAISDHGLFTADVPETDRRYDAVKSCLFTEEKKKLV